MQMFLNFSSFYVAMLTKNLEREKSSKIVELNWQKKIVQRHLKINWSSHTWKKCVMALFEVLCDWCDHSK